MRIKTIQAQEILDSRGEPTLKVWVTLQNGAMGEASVPSGASTGVHEAWELRDGGKRYNGKGVLKAVKNVNVYIAKLLYGYSVADQRKIDMAMIKLDGTSNKHKLGANAIVGVSLACAHAGAYSAGVPLYKWLRRSYGLRVKSYVLPTPLMNVFNGGKHADTNLDVQEYLIVPHGFRTVREKIRVGSEIFHALAKVLKRAGKDTDVGNEGGYAPRVSNNEDPLKYIMKAIREAKYKPGTQVSLGVDMAASEFYDPKTKKYVFTIPKKNALSTEMMIKLYEYMMHTYPMLSIEDPFAEDDWDSWVELMRRYTEAQLPLQRKLSFPPLIIGDDLYATNVERLKKGIELGATNAILIKPNQIGTLSETMDTILLAQKHMMKIVISHRSGETLDTTIADLAVSVNAEYIKTGAPSRGERISKYNRLMEIERELKEA
ncbi:phosphopyruvate hydratase [Candidatus Uhrbacteria bacterium RIFCSPLOWO2_01_FULL_47_24]|uniref:Enolase n=1 Tax=Candidatus Uhrbacteria bacterium RIFCSPLOWO2_01_FULL_47_24 TaxID=1802401 RepID=A0A1F7UQT5_9BACT|nr:MAG: phosphopyruvate hydratase [Candidatus Uhrbacteria bacterium RIFCSPHIGHO2_01_FULL_47_11]OGL68525.1 MAG: phosphopyruvate hydratase [Candidatus Uhrbacteria bacterium RIFCSPHIGHO2_02_FULL_46_47]OGL76826.1 MAG: phosphopyruvate hydratase [Candidatus Uhrbacteria bacterium RIFCSPHIGHO2_12_FULL_47_11]OGL80058.1 MAG: phosphopyruvate hydratase [Candidatus Uhrbacteria bacterium RIFCSPLOWO2_01_FULL_47_24]OGL85273.1 MAG: phosphopyruvate hydratase [Candidatus Uhrbacteria bacterium RIFCSPLOWO2_02_FULL_